VLLVSIRPLPLLRERLVAPSLSSWRPSRVEMPTFPTQSFVGRLPRRCRGRSSRGSARLSGELPSGARLGRIGSLGCRSIPALAVELQAIAREPLPSRPEEDDVWSAVCEELLVDVAESEYN
jgi:hypothetical protein